MSAVFYNKYRSLFFDDNDKEPISYQYFNSKPKNYLNISPSNNIASLAQQYNILPKNLEIPKGKVEEIYESPPQYKPQLPQRLDPLPYKPPSLPNFEIKPKIPSIEYYIEPPPIHQDPPKRAPSVQKLPPIVYENTKNNIFPDKIEQHKPTNPFQEAAKRRKDAKGQINERRKRLRELLMADKVI